MPSPVGHTALGLAVADLAPVRLSQRRWVEIVAVALLANLPDLDFIPGYLLGEPLLYHRGGLHSLAAAVAAGILVGLTYRALGRSAMPYLLLGGALFTSHLLLDSTTDPGAPLLWPLFDGYVLAPWSPFLPIDKTTTSDGFIQSLLTTHNAVAALWEAVLLVPLALLSHWRRASRSRPDARATSRRVEST